MFDHWSGPCLAISARVQNYVSIRGKMCHSGNFYQ